MQRAALLPRNHGGLTSRPESRRHPRKKRGNGQFASVFPISALRSAVLGLVMEMFSASLFQNRDADELESACDVATPVA